MNKDKLIKAGFNVKKYTHEIEISKSLLNRYKNLPTEYLTFLKKFKEIVNETHTTWFNLSKEFNGTTENEFKWNEFELLSIEWSEEDVDELTTIAEFWNKHIPVIMSVKDQYQFLAICLEKEKYGEIVHGTEPAFENVTKICNDFNELVDLLERKGLQNIVYIKT